MVKIMVRLPPRLGYDSMIPFWNVMACVLSTEFMRGQFTFIPISSHLQLNKRPLVLQSAKLRAGSSFWWWEGNVSHESAYQTQLKSRRMCLNDTGNVNHVERSPHFNFFGPRSISLGTLQKFVWCFFNVVRLSSHKGVWVRLRYCR